MHERFALLNLLALILFVTCSVGCRPSSGPATRRIPEGTMCKIQLRRDALGGNDLLVSPHTDVMNGTPVSLVGELESMNDQWIVIIDGDDQVMWIARDAVLLIKVNP